MSYSNNYKNYNMKTNWVDAPHIYRTGMFYGSERYSAENVKERTISKDAAKSCVKKADIKHKKPLSVRVLEYIFCVN